jgi:hypothetical protein
MLSPSPRPLARARLCRCSLSRAERFKEVVDLVWPHSPPGVRYLDLHRVWRRRPEGHFDEVSFPG